jgi:hypothetical protein
MYFMGSFFTTLDFFPTHLSRSICINNVIKINEYVTHKKLNNQTHYYSHYLAHSLQTEYTIIQTIHDDLTSIITLCMWCRFKNKIL